MVEKATTLYKQNGKDGEEEEKKKKNKMVMMKRVLTR